MKGSVFVLLACFAFFFAAPSHSYSISEEDQLANRRDARSGSPSTDAVESGTIEADVDANPGDESVAGDAQAEKSETRKRNARSLDGNEMDTVIAAVSPVDKLYALNLFRLLGKQGGKCFEQAVDYIGAHEVPIGFTEPLYPEVLFTRSDMVKWLEIIKDSVSECLMNYVDQLDVEPRRDYGTPDSMRSLPESDAFANQSEFLSLLTGIGKTLKKCFEDAIRFLEATSDGPRDTVQRSSESFSDLLTELIEIMSIIDGRVVPAGDTVPMVPPGPTASHYLDSVPVTTTYKKRNSPDKSRRYRYYANLPGFKHPQYVFTGDSSNSIAPQLSGFREEEVQVPYTPGITTLPEGVNALPTQKLTLLDIVLDNIYAKLQGKVTAGVSVEAAPVEGVRFDANDASGLYPGSGGSPAMENPDCAYKRMQ